MPIHFPVTFDFFGNEVLLHPVLESVGIFLAMRMYYFLKRKTKDKTTLVDSLSILVGATAGALFGSKLIGNLENPTAILSPDFTFIKFWTSNTIVGGLAFGLIGVEIAKKIIGSKKSTGDLMVFPLITAMCIGRIGCFFTGVYEETYGLPTDSIFGMYLGDQYLRHPVALYEIAFLIVLGFVIFRLQKAKEYVSGFLFQFFMLNYFLFRFFLDFIKPHEKFLFDLGTIQIVSLLMIFYYIYKIKNSLIQMKNSNRYYG
ncbi:prolipoprotein diacylglyceryl transferase [Epilithonimonas sp. UC225_85]|uniref:prolipoprotein diacylglyceryl transferase n=1 Tax=Epilithonimonas sp. UC225_85 TaxID=3350167 RepID=UPI0036D28D9A